MNQESKAACNKDSGITTGRKVFYIVTYLPLFGQNEKVRQYAAPLSGSAPTISQAAQYHTVDEAMSRIVASSRVRGEWMADKDISYRIVRVTEVPGTTERKITATCVVDLSKPVAVQTAHDGRWRFVGSQLYGWETLQDALIFPDAASALRHIAVHPQKIRSSSSFGPHLVNVETVTTEPAFIEEALQ